jgi:transcriptional regulator with XRE-family HTH domain
MLQKEVAYQIGVAPSYLSALAGGRKGPPSMKVVQKLRDHFDLSDEERDALVNAVRFSQRIYRMPPKADPREHELVWQIMNLIGRLKPAQVNAIYEILKL